MTEPSEVRHVGFDDEWEAEEMDEGTPPEQSAKIRDLLERQRLRTMP
ncbi:MAG: hypothetical protein ABR499_08965 [Gemmatimonadaceae bacterium]